MTGAEGSEPIFLIAIDRTGIIHYAQENCSYATKHHIFLPKIVKMLSLFF